MLRVTNLPMFGCFGAAGSFRMEIFPGGLAARDDFNSFGASHIFFSSWVYVAAKKYLYEYKIQSYVDIL